MAPRSYVQIKDPSGARKAVFTAFGRDGGNNGFLSLSWKKRVNDTHIAQLTLNADNPDSVYLADKYQLEIWRSDPAIGLAEYKSFDGIIRDDIPSTDDSNRDRITATAYGENSLLARRHIAWPADKLNRTLFVAAKAETVLKTLVKYNCDPTFAVFGGGGTGRDRTPSTMNLTIATDLARGNTIDWTCGGRTNLLEELKKIVLIAGGDYAVTKTGLTSYVFEFYPGQLGTNRTTGSNPIIFSKDRGNMSEPKLIRQRSAEKTVALIGGRGEKDARNIRVRTGANFATDNDIETYIDGRNATTDAALDDIGDQGLEQARFRNVIDFDILQNALYTVEKDYFLGDLVLAKYAGITATQQVYEIAFEYSSGKEGVNIVTRTL